MNSFVSTMGCARHGRSSAGQLSNSSNDSADFSQIYPKTVTGPRIMVTRPTITTASPEDREWHFAS